MKHRSAGALIATLAVLLFGTAQASAATFTVSSKSDSGHGTLRAAVTSAESNPGADTITFEPWVEGDIALESALPSITSAVTITGPGADRVAIYGDSEPTNVRHFHLEAGANATISGLRLRSGRSDTHGGSIHVEPGATLTARELRLEHNRAPFGGAIYNEGTLTIQRSGLYWNHATGGATGGGLDTTGNAARTTIRNSTFYGNSHQHSTSVGGIMAYSGTTIIESSTVAENQRYSPAEPGAALDLRREGGALTIRSSLIAQQTGGQSSCVGVTAASSRGGNLDRGTSCNLDGATDQEDIDPDYEWAYGVDGLIVATFDLDSPLVDAGLAPGGEALDNRGSTRTVNQPKTDRPGTDGTDVGAFEAQRTRVENLGDSGPGSLRAALWESRLRPFGSKTVVNFVPALNGTITLETALPAIQGADVDILGPGAARLTVRRADGAEPFVIFDTAASATVLIQGLTIAGAHDEPAVWAWHPSTAVTIRESVVRENTGGGGVLNTGATLMVERSTITANTGEVGGIHSQPHPEAGAKTTIRDSTISGNVATGAGGTGGLRLEGGVAEIHNSTIAANTAVSGAANINSGGASLSVVSTLVGNGTGGAPSCVGLAAINSVGNNLDQGTTCAFTRPSDKRNANPLLGPLGANGGPTPTHSIPHNSPAVDAGFSEGSNSVDQRGLVRRVNLLVPNGAGDGTDIGAFEVQDADADGVADAPDRCPSAAGGGTASGCPAVGRALTISYNKKKKQFSGALTTVGASQPACLAGQRVELFLNKRGPDPIQGTATTDAAGKWALKRKAAKGKKYYAQVAPVLVPNAAECGAAKSKTLKAPK